MIAVRKPARSVVVRRPIQGMEKPSLRIGPAAAPVCGAPIEAPSEPEAGVCVLDLTRVLAGLQAGGHWRGTGVTNVLSTSSTGLLPLSLLPRYLVSHGACWSMAPSSCCCSTPLERASQFLDRSPHAGYLNQLAGLVQVSECCVNPTLCPEKKGAVVVKFRTALGR